MPRRLFKNPYRDVLQESAKLMTPGDETREKILGSVIAAAGITGAISYVGAVTKAASLGKALIAKTIGGAVAVTAAVTVTSVAGVAVLTPPAIQDLQLQSSNWKQASILVTTNSNLSTRSVVVIPENGTPLAASHSYATTYVADVYQNGVYTVEVTAQSGRTAIATVSVNNIDDTIPTMHRYTTDEETITIYLSDSLSGVDWDSIFAISSDGYGISPRETNEEGGYVVFPLPTTNLDVYVSDYAGNQGKITVSVK